LKQALSSLAKDFDTHTHTELEVEVAKLKTGYSKTNVKIDELQGENHRLLENIYELNKELKRERMKFTEATGNILNNARSESRLYPRRHKEY
jgi:peptidoglycan hydrolase CwlO-like protein